MLGTWDARLSLSFAGGPLGTYLAQSRSHGPYLVQRPFKDQDGTCQVYLLHPPGGVASGDSLTLHVACASDTRTLVTTPAATKIYRSLTHKAHLEQRFSLDSGAILEWLPQETIVFDGAVAQSKTVVELGVGAQYAGWEITCLGRPAAGEKYTRGEYQQSVEVWRGRDPLVIERCQLNGGSEVMDAPWGVRGHCVMGTFLCTGAHLSSPSAISELRDCIPRVAGMTSVSQVNDVILCRYLGEHGDEARTVFSAVWARLRPLCLERTAVPPRVWAT
jgi:urease accessory protein